MPLTSAVTPELWSQGIAAAVTVIAAAVTGSCTLLAVRMTQTASHRTRLLEWTLDKSFECLAGLDTAHREVVHDLVRIANEAKQNGSYNPDEDPGHQQIVSRYSDALSRCGLLTQNLEVQKRLECLRSSTEAAATHVVMAPGKNVTGRKDFLPRFQQLLIVCIDEREALNNFVRGDLATMTRSASDRSSTQT